jgi:hypothetical protein
MKLYLNPLKNADVLGILKPGGQFTKEMTQSLNNRGLGSFTHFHNDIAPWIAAAVASYGALGAGAAGGGAAGSGGLAGLGGTTAGAGAGAASSPATASSPAWLKYAKLANLAMNMGGQGGGGGYGGPPPHQFVGPENQNPYTEMLRRRMYG